MNLEPLTVPGSPDYLSQLLDYVVWAAAANGVDEATIYRLSLAVDEIATNIVLHGYGMADSPGDLTIWAESDEEAFRIFLEDAGEPFDPRDAPQPADLELPLEERKDGGLGIFLALWGVDEFTYERIGETNRCIFKVYREGDSPPVDENKPRIG